MCNASAHGRSVAWRVTCYASVHDVSMPHPTPPPCSRLIRRLKHCTYEKYGDIKIQHTLTGRRINRLPKTTVKATNICPLKRSNTYNPYSPLKRSLCHNCATMGYRTKMDKATGPSKGRVNSSICKGLTHLRHCGTSRPISVALHQPLGFWTVFAHVFLRHFWCIYIYSYIYIYII